MKPTKAQRTQLRQENRNWPKTLKKVSVISWPRSEDKDDVRVAVWRSRDFLVQVFVNSDLSHRISVNRTDCDKDGNWLAGITWDELMQIKRECGYGENLAVEFYPPDAGVVNVSNMRHLFVVNGTQLPKHWKK